MKTVSDKVVRTAFIGLTIRTKMVGDGLAEIGPLPSKTPISNQYSLVAP